MREPRHIPPGRAKLSIKPLPDRVGRRWRRRSGSCGSPFRKAATPTLLCTRITAGAKPTRSRANPRQPIDNSIAPSIVNTRRCVALAPAQQRSSSLRNAPTRSVISKSCSPRGIKMPIRLIRSPCCAGAASGHAPPHHQQQRETPAAACSPPGSTRHLSAQTSALIGAEPASLLQHEMLADVRVGQSRPFWPVQAMSAFPPIATIKRTFPDVRKVPLATKSHRSKMHLYSITSSARARR